MISVNSEYKRLGNSYWTPWIFSTLWLEAETGKVPVSGAGYRGKFSGYGFDSMWTDMSEIVRPTRDGIHGREYISTSVDIGKKPSYLSFDNDRLTTILPPVISLPFPVIFDIPSENHTLPQLDPFILETARRTGLIAIVSSKRWDAITLENKNAYLNHVAFFLEPDSPEIPEDLLRQTRLVELPDGNEIVQHVNRLKKALPECVVAVRVLLDKNGANRVKILSQSGIDTFHLIADINGNEIGASRPRFIKDVVREIHGMLIKNEIRDEVTLIAGGGIALAEHVAKAIICGADLVSVNIPLMIALECHLCNQCKPGDYCPAKLDKDIDFDYASGRMTNMIGAWYWQMVELMGAMGMREARRLRGDVGRAMFKEELEEDVYGPIFRKQSKTTG
jgi:hypothetical protein